MAKNETQHEESKLPAIQAPDGLFDLASKYPKYAGGDARALKEGAKGPPIHGRLLGMVDLPSVLKGPDGESKEWRAFVIQLLQPTMVQDIDEDVPRVAKVGERIVLTVSKVLESYVDLVREDQTIELYIEPVVARTRAGQSLWNFAKFMAGRPMPRKPNERLGAIGQFAAPAPAAPALPAATAPNGSA